MTIQDKEKLVVAPLPEETQKKIDILAGLMLDKFFEDAHNGIVRGEKVSHE